MLSKLLACSRCWRKAIIVGMTPEMLRSTAGHRGENETCGKAPTKSGNERLSGQDECVESEMN